MYTMLRKYDRRNNTFPRKWKAGSWKISRINSEQKQREAFRKGIGSSTVIRCEKAFVGLLKTEQFGASKQSSREEERQEINLQVQVEDTQCQALGTSEFYSVRTFKDIQYLPRFALRTI